MYLRLAEKEKKKRLAMQLLSSTRTNELWVADENWPVNLDPVGTFRKRWRHNISFNPLENDAKTLRVDTNFLKTGKKVAFSNEYGYVWAVPHSE